MTWAPPPTAFPRTCSAEPEVVLRRHVLPCHWRYVGVCVDGFAVVRALEMLQDNLMETISNTFTYLEYSLVVLLIWLTVG